MIGSKRVLATALLALSPFAAQAVETNYVFDHVSAVRARLSNVTITGILVGDSVPTSVTTPSGGPTERCDRLFNLVLSQPGAYTLTVTIDTSFVTLPGDPTPVPLNTFVGCTVELKP